MNNVNFVLCKFQLTIQKNIIFIAIQGSINKHTTLQVQKYCRSFQEKNTIIILSLSEVNYVDSTGLGVLVNLQQECEEKNIELNLCMVPAKIHHLFSMLGMTSCFTIFDSIKAVFDEIDKKYGLDYPVTDYLDKIKSAKEKSQTGGNQKGKEVVKKVSKAKEVNEKVLLDITYTEKLYVKKQGVIQVKLQGEKDIRLQVVPSISGCIVQPPFFYLTNKNFKIYFSVTPMIPEKQTFLNLDIFSKNHQRFSYPVQIKRWGTGGTVLQRVVKLECH